MILEKICAADKQYDLFEGAKRVVVACSGGADSMALLVALCEIADDYGFSVTAAHFNHGIRGEEAVRDEKFVEEFCKKNAIDFVCESANVPEYAERSGKSIELAAREKRYDFLKSVAKDGVVATAHHAGDNLETILFNLVRGTALSGLCGIPVKRDIYIRPMLFCTRAEIETYCKEKQIPFVTDSSNLSDDYSRNRMRHNVVPVLEEMQPRLFDAVSRTAQSIREDEEYLLRLATDEYNNRLCDDALSLEGFPELAGAVAKRVIKLFFADRTGENPDFLHITKMYDCCMQGGAVSLPGNFEARVQKNLLTIKTAQKERDIEFRVEINEKNIDFLENNKKIHNLLLNNSLDCDKIVGKLVLRTREPSDSVYINGRGGTKTLKKLYNEYKIPICKRKNLPVIADEKGIVWIAQIGVAKRCVISKSTRRIYDIKVTEVKGNV